VTVVVIVLRRQVVRRSVETLEAFKSVMWLGLPRILEYSSIF